MKLKPAPLSPQGIHIIKDPDRQAELDGPSMAALDHFRKQVYDFGNKTGIHYHNIDIRPDFDRPCGFSTFSDSTQHTLGTDVHFLKRLQQANVDIEGVLAHEARHTQLDHGVFRKQLALTASVFDQLAECRQGLEDDPQRTEREITERFGSVASFIKALSSFEKEAAGGLGRLASKPEAALYSPEKWARLIENNDETYQWVKATARKLPSLRALQSLRDNTISMTDSYPEGEITAAKANKSTLSVDGKQLSEQLDRLLQHPSVAMIGGLNEGLSKGEEYVADEYAVKNSANPRSMIEYLRFVESLPTLQLEEPANARKNTTHPSTSQRIQRMEHIIRHGHPPQDETLAEGSHASRVRLGGSWSGAEKDVKAR